MLQTLYVIYFIINLNANNGLWLFATPPRPNALLWLFQCTNIFKFRVRVKLDYIRLD